jgi:uncharacterized membrane protein YkvA (DUF1232 family)
MLGVIQDSQIIMVCILILRLDNSYSYNFMTGKRIIPRPWMLKKEIIVLYYALQDKRTSLVAKIPAVLSVIYLLSPIDWIPDFIPFFGYVDDIVVVPLLLNLAIRLLPQEVREESLERASKNQKKFVLATILVLLLIISALVGIFFLIRHLFNK